MRHAWTRTLLLLLLLALPAAAQRLALEIEIDPASGTPSQVTVRGRVQQACWLGISFYPYGTENALRDGEHQLLELVPGRFEHTFKVPERHVGGSVECAIWNTRVLREDCSGPCEWCLGNGYHVEDRRVYLYGSLAPVLTD
jgi:hypothetical protein